MPGGRAIGLDVTSEMLELARGNAVKAGVTNVEFIEGYLEDIPLPDASIDVVISNCVINLAADKRVVLAEAAGVLRPGGRACLKAQLDPDAALEEQGAGPRSSQAALAPAPCETIADARSVNSARVGG